jgi:pyruvate dehydrogenase E2 component (dihydrolipoamide acetyltransferase)
VQEIVMPSLGMAPGDVYLAEWVVEPGSAVAAGDVVALIETDKAELSLEAAVSGTLGHQLVAAGDVAPAGSTIGWILESGEVDPADAGAASSPPVLEVDSLHAATDPSLVEKSVSSRSDRARDPLTRELSPYTQSPRARAQQPTPIPEETSAAPDLALPPEVPVPVTPRPNSPVTDSAVGHGKAPSDRFRNAVANAVSQSWAEIPHFAVTREIRTEKLQEVLRGFRILYPSVTFTDVLLKTYALSLIERIGTTSIDLGVAVATPSGVVIPVLPSVATSDLITIARLRKAAVERALLGQIVEDDMIVPHSTLSNLGAFGVDSFTGIVPVGQTSILTVGASAERPVVDQGAIAVGVTMHVTLNVDHRVWDGQHAALALQRLAAIATEPSMLLALSAAN